MNPDRFRLARLAGVAGLALALAGCALLPRAGEPPPSLYVLAPEAQVPARIDAPAQEIDVAAPEARPGFDGPRMAYVTRPYELQFFARHQWLEAPARMLGPLLVEALERSGHFDAGEGGEGFRPGLRLETEIVALQQEFTVRPSQLRFRLRARLQDLSAHRVLATSVFEAVEAAPSEDPYGGVIAANRAVARVLGQLAAWCAEAGKREPGGEPAPDPAP